MKTIGWAMAAVLGAVILLGPWVARAGATEPAKATEEPSLGDVVARDFFAGLDGDSAAMDRVVKRCDEELSKEPDNAEALAWRGSCRMYRSGQAFEAGRTQEGRAAWEAALREMDRALMLEPDSPDVLIPRGMTLSACAAYAPASESRTMLEAAVADLEHALEVLGEEFNDSPVSSRGPILTALADGHDGLGNAEAATAYRERIVEELGATPFGATAQARLRQQAQQAQQAEE